MRRLRSGSGSEDRRPQTNDQSCPASAGFFSREKLTDTDAHTPVNWTMENIGDWPICTNTKMPIACSPPKTSELNYST